LCERFEEQGPLLIQRQLGHKQHSVSSQTTILPPDR